MAGVQWGNGAAQDLSLEQLLAVVQGWDLPALQQEKLSWKTFPFSVKLLRCEKIVIQNCNVCQDVVISFLHPFLSLLLIIAGFNSQEVKLDPVSEFPRLVFMRCIEFWLCSFFLLSATGRYFIPKFHHWKFSLLGYENKQTLRRVVLCDLVFPTFLWVKVML